MNLEEYPRVFEFLPFFHKHMVTNLNPQCPTCIKYRILAAMLCGFLTLMPIIPQPESYFWLHHSHVYEHQEKNLYFPVSTTCIKMCEYHRQKVVRMCVSIKTSSARNNNHYIVPQLRVFFQTSRCANTTTKEAKPWWATWLMVQTSHPICDSSKQYNNMIV